MRRDLSRYVILIIGIAAVAFLSCAASAKPHKMTDEELLRKRAAEYWNDRVKGDLHLSYEYEIPSYRKQVGMVDYIKGFGQVVRWTDAEIKGVDVDGERARVDVHVRFKYQVPKIKTKSKMSEDNLRERWVKLEGKWYHIPSGFVDQ